MKPVRLWNSSAGRKRSWKLRPKRLPDPLETRRRRRAALEQKYSGALGETHQGCREGEEILYEGESALVGRLGKYVGKARDWRPLIRITPTLGLLESSLAQLQEAALQLGRYADRVHFDPRALEQLDDRLAEIQRLKRKYNGDIEEILAPATGISGNHWILWSKGSSRSDPEKSLRRRVKPRGTCRRNFPLRGSAQRIN